MSEPTRHEDNEETISDAARLAHRGAGADSFHAHGVPDVAGTFVGKYQIKREIASGGMGIVYEAVQDQPRRVVALKLMRAGLGSRAAVHRFEAEAQTLARLHHPNIAQVYEAGTHEAGAIRVPYFAMEYIPGAQAIDTYANANRLGTIDRLRLFAVVCDAVHHGHTRGIIHRDLKPQNVLVGADGVLKVIDFGVARAVDSDQTSPTLQTSAGSVIGTPLYCSPEQFEGDPNALDGRTDVYSLGMLLYELLLARLPYTFASGALAEVGRVVCTAQPVRPSKVKRELGRDVDAVILTALQKDRALRYPSPAALAADVRCLINGEPVSKFASRRTLVGVTRMRSAIVRHPAGTALFVMITSWIIAWQLALPLVYLTPAHRWVQSRLVSLVPYGDPSRELESVKVIAINDDTDLAAISQSEKLSELSAADSKSQRRLIGRLLEKLADTDVRTVVLDMAFVKESKEFDADLVKGIRAFRTRGDVIVGTNDWGIGAGASPLIAPSIFPEVASGCMLAGIQGNAPWALELFVEHADADALPGLALTALGRFRNPGAVLSFSPRDYIEAIEIRYREATTQPVAIPRIVGKSDQVELSTVRRACTDDVRVAVQKGDMVGRFVVPMPSTKALTDSTVEIGKVLKATPQELWNLIGRRPVVLVANGRTGVDTYTYVDGRVLRGFHAQATAIDMLLRGKAIREPRRSHEWALMWLGVVAGVGIARFRGFGLQLLTLAAFALIGVLAAVVAYRMSWLTDPLICAVPLLVAYAISLVIARQARTIR